MSGYDGSIRIDTSINTKNASAQLMALENRIAKTARKIAGLRSKMDALKDTKIPTQEYQEIQRQIEATEKKINDLLAHQEKFLAAGGKKASSTYKNMEYDLDELRNSLPYLQGELQDLVDTGKAFTLGSGTEEFKKLGLQQQDAENELGVLLRRHDELLQKQEANAQSYKQLGNSAVDALKTVGRNIYKYAINPFISLGKTAAKTFLGIGRGSKSSNNMLNKGFKNIIKYGLGIRSIYALVNMAKEGFKNLARASAPVNASLSALKSSLTQLRNSLATAFAPILTTVTPLLASLIDMLSKAATHAGMLVAVLTGKGSFIKAVAVQEDYAASLEKTGSAAKKAFKALAGFDKLNVLGKNDSDSGTGAGGTSPKDMFEEVEIPDSFRDIAKELKKMWEDADFAGLGKDIGEWLKKALDSIPWNEIKQKACNIGKSLATMINGFIEADGLGYSIGRTLAEAVNTGFEFLNSFVHTLHWDSIGKFIADTLNGFFENIDWDLIRDTFVTGFKGLADAINSFVDNFNWDNVSDTISNAINIIAETVYTFFTTVDWEKLGKELGNQLKETIRKIDWEELGRAIGSVIQAALDFVTGFIGEQDFGEVAQAVVDALKGFFETADMGQLAEVIMAALTIQLAVKATASLFKTAAGAILNALCGAIKASPGAFSSIATTILGGISGGIAAVGGIGNLLTADVTALVAEGGAAAAGATFGAAIIGGVAAAIGG